MAATHTRYQMDIPILVDGIPKSSATISSRMDQPLDNDSRTGASNNTDTGDSPSCDPKASAATVVQMESANSHSSEAVEWAKILQAQLSMVASSRDTEQSSPPLINEIIMQAPRRHAANPAVATMANEVAKLLYPHHSNPLGAVIQYEKELVNLRNLVVDQRKRIISENIKRNDLFDWSKRVMNQGPWDPLTDPLPLTGPPALPMPVKVADAESLVPFFEHLALDGTEDISSTARAAKEATEIEEPYYHVKSLEFEKGVLYSDHRLDLCKMVLGPTHIESLMTSLRTNKFVEHFLLGNNIIGPYGAQCIADFLKEFPDRIDTWYLAGNCIDSTSFALLVDEWVKSSRVTNIWLKRNPLMPESANDLFRLITQTPNLRTLDLAQTELGDAGVAELFSKLANHTPEGTLPLRHIYLNAVGIGTKGATAIAEYLALSHCELDAMYMTNNPLGNEGVLALAQGLKKNKSLTRLTITSVGMSDDGAIALCEALCEHPSIKVVDLGQNFATQDLDSRYVHSFLHCVPNIPISLHHLTSHDVLISNRYNFITDRSAHAIRSLVATSPQLAYLNLSQCALTHVGLNTILAAVKDSCTLQHYFAKTIHPQDRAATSIAAGQEHARLSKLAHATLEANVGRIYGVTYQEFSADHKRWLVNDKTDVRKIDSVYRNRDAGLARRGLKKLDKWWDEGDETLSMVAKGAVKSVPDE